MYSKDFDNRQEKPLRIYQKMQESMLNSIRKILPDKVIDRACRECNYQYRHRLLTPTVVVFHLIMAAIWPEESFNACWQVMWATATAQHPEIAGQCPARSSVSLARNRLPRQVMDAIFHWLCEQAQKLSQPYDSWRGHRVVLVDGTCLTASDEATLHQEFGAPTGCHGRGRYPLARLVTLCLSHTMTVLSYHAGTYCTDENTLLHPLLKSLRKGDLLVADRHFAGANLYCRYLDHGLEFVTRAHPCLKISKIKRRLVYNENDFIGYLKISRSYQLKDPSLPDKIKVRFIRTRTLIRGRKQDLWLVTSLLDAEHYPAAEVVEVCGKRWRIETLFRELKINGHADILRSKTVDGVYREIAARMAAINILRSLMLEAAIHENLEDPLRISFTESVRITLSFAPALSLRPLILLPGIYQAMLKEISAHQVPWRPDRNEPRAITHEPKSYPSLKTTREQWRKTNAA